MKKSFYDELGVDKSASQQEIRRAYYKLSRKQHPDKSSTLGATRRFQSLAEAYAVLSDPVLRSEYDSPLQHKGVTCNVCGERPLQGIRHWCRTCNEAQVCDFDVCTACFEGDSPLLEDHDGHIFRHFDQPSGYVSSDSDASDRPKKKKRKRKRKSTKDREGDNDKKQGAGGSKDAADSRQQQDANTTFIDDTTGGDEGSEENVSKTTITSPKEDYDDDALSNLMAEFLARNDVPSAEDEQGTHAAVAATAPRGQDTSSIARREPHTDTQIDVALTTSQLDNQRKHRSSRPPESSHTPPETEEENHAQEYTTSPVEATPPEGVVATPEETSAPEHVASASVKTGTLLEEHSTPPGKQRSIPPTSLNDDVAPERQLDRPEGSKAPPRRPWRKNYKKADPSSRFSNRRGLYKEGSERERGGSSNDPASSERHSARARGRRGSGDNPSTATTEPEDPSTEYLSKDTAATESRGHSPDRAAVASSASLQPSSSAADTPPTRAPPSLRIVEQLPLRGLSQGGRMDTPEPTAALSPEDTPQDIPSPDSLTADTTLDVPSEDSLTVDIPPLQLTPTTTVRQDTRPNLSLALPAKSVTESENDEENMDNHIGSSEDSVDDGSREGTGKARVDRTVPVVEMEDKRRVGDDDEDEDGRIRDDITLDEEDRVEVADSLDDGSSSDQESLSSPAITTDNNANTDMEDPPPSPSAEGHGSSPARKDAIPGGSEEDEESGDMVTLREVEMTMATVTVIEEPSASLDAPPRRGNRRGFSLKTPLKSSSLQEHREESNNGDDEVTDENEPHVPSLEEILGREVSPGARGYASPSPSSLSSPDRATRAEVECRGCTARITARDVRFWCWDCPRKKERACQYNLCVACYSSRRARKHRSRHRFAIWGQPRVTFATEESVSLKDPSPIAECEGCATFPIAGQRFWCSDCPSSRKRKYNLCLKCFACDRASKHRSKHQFCLINEAPALSEPATSSRHGEPSGADSNTTAPATKSNPPKKSLRVSQKTGAEKGSFGAPARATAKRSARAPAAAASRKVKRIDRAPASKEPSKEPSGSRRQVTPTTTPRVSTTASTPQRTSPHPIRQATGTYYAQSYYPPQMSGSVSGSHYMSSSASGSHYHAGSTSGSYYNPPASTYAAPQGYYSPAPQSRQRRMSGSGSGSQFLWSGSASRSGCYNYVPSPYQQQARPVYYPVHPPVLSPQHAFRAPPMVRRLPRGRSPRRRPGRRSK